MKLTRVKLISIISPLFILIIFSIAYYFTRNIKESVFFLFAALLYIPLFYLTRNYYIKALHRFGIVIKHVPDFIEPTGGFIFRTNIYNKNIILNLLGDLVINIGFTTIVLITFGVSFFCAFALTRVMKIF